MKRKQNHIATKKEVDKMTELYAQGLSAAAICRVLPYTPHTILSHLRKRGISIRGKAGYKEPFREDYFEKIDTEEKAYFLGYFMADGCITERKKSQPCIAMQLKSSDEYILEKLKYELKTKNKIGVNLKRGHSHLKVHSKKMANDLFVYGIGPRKTGHETFPEEKIPPKLIPHFIRGFFDGDGWFTFTSSHGVPKKRISLGFSGNISMLTKIKYYFIQHLPQITNLKIHQFKDYEKGYKGFSSVIFSKFDNVKSIGEFMYSNATVYLKRKKQVFDEAVKLIPSRRRIGRPRNA